MGSKLIPKHYRHFTPEELKVAILPYFEVEKNNRALTHRF